MSCRQQKDAMMDHEGPESTISWGHVRSKGTGRSLLLGEYNELHGQKIDGIRHRTTVSAGELYQTDGG